MLDLYAMQSSSALQFSDHISVSIRGTRPPVLHVQNSGPDGIDHPAAICFSCLP